jgi:hypothetical protein
MYKKMREFGTICGEEFWHHGFCTHPSQGGEYSFNELEMQIFQSNGNTAFSKPMSINH